MFFAPIGFATIEGSGNVVLLSYNVDPRVNYIVFFFDFGCGVELGDRGTLFRLDAKLSRMIKQVVNILFSQ